MGVRTVALLRALRDRHYSRVDFLAIRLRWAESDVEDMLARCQAVNVAFQDQEGRWLLTRPGRQLLEAHEERAVSPASIKLGWMMRSNRGLRAA